MDDGIRKTKGKIMVPAQAQGIHHVTLNGANRKVSIDFWDGIMGMKLLFEQPNLDNLSINHLYFDCGDGRTLTVFTEESRKPTGDKLEQSPGSIHHIAFWVSQATIRGAADRLNSAGISNTGIKDRGFMDSLYFRDPLGLLIEIASYNFFPPIGHSHADVLALAHKLRLERDAINIEVEDVAAAISSLRIE